MARLIYSSITSLDGRVEDRDGNFDWATPDEEVFTFINDLERPVGTYLYGRRMYEAMVYWETADALPDQSPVEEEFAKIWRAAEKIVYSTTLPSVSSARTRIERRFDPEEVRQLQARTTQDITVAGSTLAGVALELGLVDELRLFVNPVSVGGGKAALPDELRLHLELMELRRFDSGVVYLRYRTT
jgi:dihydrofolate reductase